jgi:hypothetical protein
MSRRMAFHCDIPNCTEYGEVVARVEDDLAKVPTGWVSVTMTPRRGHTRIVHICRDCVDAIVSCSKVRDDMLEASELTEPA